MVRWTSRGREFDCVKAPKIGLFKVERPEVKAWEFEEYARLLTAPRQEGAEWHVAVCLAGEAGLRVGEIKALRWREDVDMIARTITVNQQSCDCETTTPKGRTRRVVPMTETLYSALAGLSTIREGLVVRNADGTPKADGETDHVIARVCRRAGLPQHHWHKLRHTFGTHAALCGVNPWRLQAWLGHKRIDETMLYVHVAYAHARELPEALREASLGVPDPDLRVIAMLGARVPHAAVVDAGATRKVRRPAGPPVAHDRAQHLGRGTQQRVVARRSFVLVGSGGGLRMIGGHE